MYEFIWEENAAGEAHHRIRNTADDACIDGVRFILKNAAGSVASFVFDPTDAGQLDVGAKTADGSSTTTTLSGGSPTYGDEDAQDAVGCFFADFLAYQDGGPCYFISGDTAALDGSAGTDGQVWTSTGSGAQWEDASGGGGGGGSISVEGGGSLLSSSVDTLDFKTNLTVSSIGPNEVGVTATASASAGVLTDLAAGLIVYGSSGTGRDTVNPANTTTPIQDAVDALEAIGADGKIIWLPPGNIQESGLPIVIDDSITVRGFNPGSWGSGLQGTCIDLQSDNADGIHLTGHAHALYDIAIDGNRTGRTLGGTEALIKFDENASKTTLDRLRFFNHYGCAIRADDATFETNVGMIQVDELDAGDTGGVIDWSGLGAPNRWEYILCYTDTDQSGSHSDIFNANGNHHIDVMNIGGAPDIAVDSFDGQIKVGMMNYEPDPELRDTAGASNTIVDIGGEGCHFAYIQVYGDTYTDHAYTLHRDNEPALENMYLCRPSLRSGGGFSSSDLVVVNEDTTGPGVIYEGTSSEVNNASGGTLSHQVSCLGNLTGVT